MENLKLENGKLLRDVWDKKTKIMERNIDVSHLILYALNYPCKLGPELTLKDIFKLICSINNYPVLSPLLTGGNCLKEIIEEGLQPPLNKSSLQYINIGWRATLNDENEFGFNTDVYGSIDGDKEKYALDMSITCNIIDCKIKLVEDISITDETKNGFEILKQTGMFPVLIKGKKEHTLLDILRGIFWELSFFGGPKERDIQIEKIAKSIEDIKQESK